MSPWPWFLTLVIVGAALIAWLMRVPPDPAPGALRLAAVGFADLPGWSSGDQAGVIPAQSRSCRRFARLPGERAVGPGAIAGTVADWRSVCAALEALPAEDHDAAREFFEDRFRVYAVSAGGESTGLFTGYYEPHLDGARQRSERYSVPLYRRPPDLVTVDLGPFRDDLKGRRIAGRLVGTRLEPFPDRAAIEAGALAGQGLELLWVDDPIAAFFLHIQGSGRVTLDDGTSLRVGYAGQNGHPYTAIGRVLLNSGALPKGGVSLQLIRDWLKANPDQAQTVMNANASYVFFHVLEEAGPVGAQGVVLTPERSLAVDRRLMPLGVPFWVDSHLPEVAGGTPWRRLMVAQDTGGAIRGPVRGDVFWGFGARAERIAGHMQSRGRYFMLLPKHLQPSLPAN